MTRFGPDDRMRYVLGYSRKFVRKILCINLQYIIFPGSVPVSCGPSSLPAGFTLTASQQQQQQPADSKHYQNIKSAPLMIDESNLDTEEDLVTPTIEQLSILDEKVKNIQDYP